MDENQLTEEIATVAAEIEQILADAAKVLTPLRERKKVLRKSLVEVRRIRRRQERQDLEAQGKVTIKGSRCQRTISGLRDDGTEWRWQCSFSAYRNGYCSKHNPDTPYCSLCYRKAKVDRNYCGHCDPENKCTAPKCRTKVESPQTVCDVHAKWLSELADKEASLQDDFDIEEDDFDIDAAMDMEEPFDIDEAMLALDLDIEDDLV